MRRALYRLLGLFGLTVMQSCETVETVYGGWGQGVVYREIIPGSRRRWIARNR